MEFEPLDGGLVVARLTKYDVAGADCAAWIDVA